MAEGIQREVSWGAGKAIRSLKPQGENQMTAQENKKEDFAESKIDALKGKEAAAEQGQRRQERSKEVRI